MGWGCAWWLPPWTLEEFIGPVKTRGGGGIYDIFARERPLLRGEFMLPTGDCDLWLYLQGIFFICIGTTFTANNYFSPLCVFFFFFFKRCCFCCFSHWATEFWGRRGSRSPDASSSDSQASAQRWAAARVAWHAVLPEHPDVAELLGLRHWSSAAR